MADYLLVANGLAGGGHQEVAEEAERVLAASGAVEVAWPPDLDALQHGITQDLRGRRLIAIGGDGTLHVVANILAQAGLLGDVEVGLVPAGTGNDFARTLGLPLDDPTAAATIARDAPARPTDLMTLDLDGRTVTAVNAAHAGIGAAAARNASAVKAVAGPAAYPLGALVAGFTERGWALEVSVDGAVVHPSEEPLLMVALCNGATIGGGTPLAPDAVVDDGMLEVLVVTATGPAARAGFAGDLRNGEHLARDDVRVLRGREVAIRGEDVDWNLDGELSDGVAVAAARVRPGALRLARP